MSLSKSSGSKSGSSGSRSSQSSKNFSASGSESSREYDISELYGNNHAEVLLVDRFLLNPRGIMSRYKFTHKAIWCADLIQANWLTNVGCFLGRSVAGTSYLEHWAFVARGTIPGMDDMVAFFVAQFGAGDYIPTTYERQANPKKYKFYAQLIEGDKRHAALQICSTKERSRVWLKPTNYKPEPIVAAPLEAIVIKTAVGLNTILPGTDILTHPGGKLVDAGFVPYHWSSMEAKSLKDLNDLMFQTSSAGKDYDAVSNNCQYFAQSLHDLAK